MKKITVFILSIILLFSFSGIATYADDEIDGGSSMSGTSSVMYAYLTTISAFIQDKALGFIISESNFTAQSMSYTIVMTCTLQRTDGSSGWTTYKTSSKTYTNTLRGDIEKTWFAPSGYAYRTYTKVQVKNSSGTVIETQTKISSVIYK